MTEELPELILESLKRHVLGNKKDVLILSWSKTLVSIDEEGTEGYYYMVVSKHSSEPVARDQYMPHEVTMMTETRLTVFASDGRVRFGDIITHGNESYVMGTPDKAEAVPDPFNPNRFEVRRAVGDKPGVGYTDRYGRPYR